MTDIYKIKRTALILFVVITVLFSLILIYAVNSLVVFATSGIAIWNAATVAASLIPIVLLTVSMIITLTLLHNIRKEESPFNLRNVKRLKIIAVMVILFEPFKFITEFIHNRYYPFVYTYIDEFGIETIANTHIYTVFNGFMFMTGLVIYCVALVLQYGIFLQNQVDETL